MKPTTVDNVIIDFVKKLRSGISAYSAAPFNTELRKHIDTLDDSGEFTLITNKKREKSDKDDGGNVNDDEKPKS
jgi:hypothetical protein